MIVTLAAVRIIDASSSSPTPGASAPTASARMVVPNGRRAGEVFMTMGHDRYVFLAVNYGVKSGLYRVESTNAANQVTPLGHVAITGGHGSWVGEVHGGATPTTVRLVDAKGAVWCTARFGPVGT